MSKKNYVSNHKQQLYKKFSQQSLTVYSLKKTLSVNLNFLYHISNKITRIFIRQTLWAFKFSNFNFETFLLINSSCFKDKLRR